MASESDSVIIHEKLPLYIKQRIIWGFLFLVFGVLVYIGYDQWYVPESSESEMVSLESFGLESLDDTEYSLNGTIYFTAQVKDEPQSFIGIHARSFSDDTGGLYSPYAARSFAKGFEQTEMYIANVLDTNDPDGWRVMWHNSFDGTEGLVEHTFGWNETDLTTSDTGLFAYSFQEEDKSESQSIADWKIAVHHFDGGIGPVIIDEAIEPHFSSDGNSLFYMKQDGIYRFDFASSTENLIFGNYTNLSTLDSFAFHTQTGTIIAAIVSWKIISVVQILNSDDVLEIGRIVTPGTVYRNPIFSPDGNHYAVQAMSEGGGISFEVRKINNQIPTYRQDISLYVPESVSLQTWLDTELIISNEFSE